MPGEGASGVNGVTNSGIINTFAVISRDGACSAKSLYLPNNDSSTSVLPRYRCLTGTFAPSFCTNANTCRRNALSFPISLLSPIKRRLILRQLVRLNPTRLISSSASLTTL